jgi:hypothetical protein
MTSLSRHRVPTVAPMPEAELRQLPAAHFPG